MKQALTVQNLTKTPFLLLIWELTEKPARQQSRIFTKVMTRANTQVSSFISVKSYRVSFP
jgi:hypothetical protein